jgi:hypothetical protein
LQPAWACVGKIALTADSTSHAIAVELTQRQPKTRVIAMGRPEDRKTVESGRTTERHVTTSCIQIPARSCIPLFQIYPRDVKIATMTVRLAKNRRCRLTTLACLAALVASTPGCDPRGGEVATPGFVPSWAEARHALELSLSTWRDTPSPLPESFDIRAVQFVDQRRKPNQRLLSFQILGQTEIENARQFTVRLNLDGEESPQLVKYNVLGREPVWVFRLENYEMTSHWEHQMDAPAATPKSDGQPAKTK